jgi:hypothetical protein
MYKTGPISDVVYAVEGGMEDWAYAAGWENQVNYSLQYLNNFIIFLRINFNFRKICNMVKVISLLCIIARLNTVKTEF